MKKDFWKVISSICHVSAVYLLIIVQLHVFEFFILFYFKYGTEA